MGNTLRNTLIGGAVGSLAGPIGSIAGAWIGSALSAPEYVITTSDGEEKDIIEMALLYVDDATDEVALICAVEPKDFRKTLKDCVEKIGWSRTDYIQVGLKVSADETPSFISFSEAWELAFPTQG